MKVAHRAFALIGAVALASSLAACGGGAQEVDADENDQSQGSEAGDSANDTKRWALTDIDDTNGPEFCADVLGPVDKYVETLGIDSAELDDDHWYGSASEYGTGERALCQAKVDGEPNGVAVYMSSYDAKEGYCDKLDRMPEWTKEGDVEGMIDTDYVDGGFDPSVTEPMIVDAMKRIDAGPEQEDVRSGPGCI